MKSKSACKNHPDREVLSFCHSCHDALCYQCLNEGPENYYCHKRKCLRGLESEKLIYGEKCPSCGATIKPNAGFCSVCGYRLKAITAEEKDDLVTLARYRNAVEAHLARTKLECEGVQAYVFDEHIMTIDPSRDLAWGGVRLKGKQSEAEKAFQILGELSKGSMVVPSFWFAFIFVSVYGLIVGFFLIFLFYQNFVDKY